MTENGLLAASTRRQTQIKGSDRVKRYAMRSVGFTEFVVLFRFQLMFGPHAGFRSANCGHCDMLIMSESWLCVRTKEGRSLGHRSMGAERGRMYGS